MYCLACYTFEVCRFLFFLLADNFDLRQGPSGSTLLGPPRHLLFGEFLFSSLGKIAEHTHILLLSFLVFFSQFFQVSRDGGLVDGKHV